MLCYQCGEYLEDGVTVCPKCGAKVAGGVGADQISVPENTAVPSGYEKKERVRSGKMWKILSGIISFVVLFIIIFMFAKKDQKQRFINMVNSVAPFEDVGYNATYKDVFNKYIRSQKWKMETSGDIYYLTLNGIDTDNESISVRFKISPTNKKNEYYIEPVQIKSGGDVRSDDVSVSLFLLSLFIAYAGGI